MRFGWLNHRAPKKLSISNLITKSLIRCPSTVGKQLMFTVLMLLCWLLVELLRVGSWEWESLKCKVCKRSQIADTSCLDSNISSFKIQIAHTSPQTSNRWSDRIQWTGMVPLESSGFDRSRHNRLNRSYRDIIKIKIISLDFSKFRFNWFPSA